MTHYTYNNKGQLTQAQDAAGVSVAYGYDTHGNLDGITNALGDASRWGYDNVGRLISFTDGTGHTTQFSYDATDNLLQVTDPLGYQTRYTYDANGSLTGFTDANGHTTTFAYDAQFNLIGVTDAMGRNTTYDYDANAGLVRITDANSHRTAYQRDQVGRLVAITDPLSRTVTFSYDDADRLTNFGRADGSDIGYQRDPLGRLTGIDYPTAPDITYSYDAIGNLTGAAYGSQWSANYEYDNAGRLRTAVDHSRNLTTRYTYDPAGRRTGLRVERGTTILYDQVYNYGVAARLSTLTDQADSPATTMGFSYDAAGRMIRVTDPGGAYVDYIYDGAGRLVRVKHQDNQGDPVAAYNYTYDAAGNLTAVNETTPVGALVTTYTYDVLDRLTTETYPQYTITYTYDPVGNLIRRVDPLGTLDYTYDTADQLQGRGSESFNYDQHGNLIAWQNARGTYDYTYGYRNLLAGLTMPGGTALAFTYDAFGRRLTAQGPAETRGFSHDGLDIILEGDSDLSQTINRYLYGNGILIARYTAQLGLTAYHSDGLENVRYLVDRSGQPFDAYRYDAFGRPAQPAGIDPNPFRFVGQRSVYQHDVAGWPIVLMGYRYYDPAGGRFFTRDPWPGDLLRPQSLNDYHYALNNPIRYSDPTGLRGAPKFRPAVNQPSQTTSPSPAGEYSSSPDLVLVGSTVAAQLPPGPADPPAVPPLSTGSPVGAQAPQALPALGRSPVSLYNRAAYWFYDWHRRYWDWRDWIEPLLRRRGIRFGAASIKTDSPRWLPIAYHGSTYALACTANGRLLAGAFHAGLFRSADAGHAVWNNVRVASVGDITVVDPNTCYAGTWYSGALKSSNGGASWSPINNGLTASDVYALAANPTALDRLFAGTEMGLFVSADGGAHWGRPTGTLPGRVVSDLAFAGNVLLAVTDLGLYRSTDGGTSWQTPTVDLPLARVNVLLVGSPASTVYAGTALGPYKSNDSGSTWTSWGTGLAGTDVHALAIDPADASHVVAGTTTGLFVSVNGGDTWTADTHDGLDGIASQVGALAFCPNGGDADLYLGTGSGVYALRTPVAPASAVISGPTTGFVQTSYTFTATVWPATTTLPITYTWQATEQSSRMFAGGGLSNTVAFTWDTPGTQAITITASNGIGAPVMASATIAITGRNVYLPLILRNY